MSEVGYEDHRHHEDEHRIDAVLAEQWAPELADCLRDAVAGASHWRVYAKQVLRCIDDRVLPHRAPARLRDLDDMRRAAEQMADVATDYAEHEDFQ